MKVNLPNNIKRTFGKVALASKQHSPEILMFVGAVGSVAAIVTACKATLKAQEVLENSRKDLNDIKVAHATMDEETYSEADYKTDLVRSYTKTSFEMVKLYAGPIILEVLSLGAMFASNRELRKRNGALVAAYGVLDGMYSKYRENVIEAFGADTDFKMRNSIKTEKVDVVEVDEEGNEKTVKKKVDICTDSGISGYSRYARFFDSSNPEWEKDPEYNKNYLICKQNYLNDLLRTKGWLCLNEVYEELGFPRTDYGQVVGWVYGPESKGDGYIDIGIFDIHSDATRRFVNGYEPVILLEFNVDGVIVDI